jgi:succinoglycan biosynthesis protein ExoM
MRRGAILIPSYRRPDGLAKALERLEQLQTDADLTIIVAENDPVGGEGTAVVRRQAQRSRFRIQGIEVAQQGVSHVRNALIGAALASPDIEFAALFDDDEWPEPQWLEALLDMQERTGAEVIGGTVTPDFAVTPPAWAGEFKLYRQEQPDGPSAMVWGTCNVLLTRSLLERMAAPWFDLQFGLTGGEDMEFFARAKAEGASFAWAAAAVVHEDVPESRTRLPWVFRRAFRIGSTNALVQLRWRYGRSGRPLILAKSLARLVRAPLLALSNPFDAARRMEALSQSARSLGEMVALMGFRYREYGAVDRETPRAANLPGRMAPLLEILPYEDGRH